ncbi:MAG: hexokinase [Spirochaetales bacterium]|jgi:hexokinase|nr:hexokinase [Spirochaetales bacterium]
MKPQVQKFLERHMLDADQISMDSLCDMFISEMKAGLAGRSSSLAMIPSFCSPDARPKAGEAVLVIDAGGTNFRTCLVTFDKSLNPVISDFRKSSMPGIKKEVSASEFFSTIADEAERLIDRSDRIGFCFSYAAEILPDHDGVPQFFSKEIKAPEVIGKHLGKELLAEFARRGHDVSKKKVIILNDTVTTLLAAKADSHAASYDGCIGFILGTGTNTAYIEKASNITKVDPSVFGSEYQIINVESGCLDISLGDIDREFLAGTNQPDNYKLEKMISGAYLGPLAFHVISHAVKEGLFSQAFCDAFSRLEALPTHELSAFLAGDETNALYACAKDEDDYDTLLELMGSFIARAAKLTAANLASAVLITDFGKDEDHPVLINADGTTFHKTAFLKSYTTEYLDAFLSEKGRRAVITQIENSPTIGSAVGALTL